jgi:hypothetical protein
LTCSSSTLNGTSHRAQRCGAPFRKYVLPLSIDASLKREEADLCLVLSNDLIPKRRGIFPGVFSAHDLQFTHSARARKIAKHPLKKALQDALTAIFLALPSLNWRNQGKVTLI